MSEVSAVRREADCPLCTGEGGETLWCDGFCRVVCVDDGDYPGFCRVILNAHMREMTDLVPADRQRLMEVVFTVEATVREILVPDKVNLASLGNVVPHLHWHVIPRFVDDRHFPDPIWAPPRRPERGRPDRETVRQRLSSRLVQTLPGSNLPG